MEVKQCPLSLSHQAAPEQQAKRLPGLLGVVSFWGPWPWCCQVGYIAMWASDTRRWDSARRDPRRVASAGVAGDDFMKLAGCVAPHKKWGSKGTGRGGEKWTHTHTDQ